MKPFKSHARNKKSISQTGVSSRKAMRKAIFTEKKMKKALHYAERHHSDKVSIKEQDLIKLNKLNKDSKLPSLLNGKILSGSKKEYQSNFKKPKSIKKKSKKQNTDEVSNDTKVDETSDSNSESFKFVNTNSERLARLQAFVDQEAKKSEKSQAKGAKETKSPQLTNSKNLIQDKKKLQELRDAQAADAREINKLASNLSLNSRTRKKVCAVYDAEFGDLIQDIESGNMSIAKDYDDCDYSDDDLEKDLEIAMGKTDSHNIKKCRERSKVTDGTNLLIENESTEDESFSKNTSSNLINEADLSNENTDSSIENTSDYDDREEDAPIHDFFDDEAEECSASESDDSQSEENRETLLFEGGGSKLPRLLTNPDVWSHKAEDIFDLYSTDSDDTDLDGFIVDDNFVEYTSESASDNSPIKINCKRKNDHSSARDTNNNGKMKRQRILSANSEDSDLPDDKTELKSILKNSTVKKAKHNRRVSFSTIKSSSETYVEECNEALEAPKECSNTNIYEDIYGRIRDKEGNIIEPEKDSSEKYIPPAQRKLSALNQSCQKKELLAKLHKKLKGLLNRLAESNMPGIASQIEGMFKEHSRNDMNETISRLLMESIVTPAMTPDRLVQDHACLIASLSANLGAEVGGHIFTEFVVRFIEDLDTFKPSGDHELDSKELDNLLHMIVQLYNFRVVDSSVIYDILHKLLENFKEKEVELILLVLRSVGFTLRKSDPLALKQFISSVQNKAVAASSKEQSFTRVRFMLEVLSAIKNNNMSKVPNYDPSHGEHLRTLMKAIVRQGCSPSELNVSLADILKSKVMGRWWIVGSAWSGGLKENQDISSTPVAPINSLSSYSYSDRFMEKAAKLHLSRPPRVSIFYALTEGSEDYVDAFEKLLQLKLPPNQEQEIFNVILLCSQRGKEYNKFYSCVTIKLCMFHKRFKRSLQFALWDKFKELTGMKPLRVSNLAKFAAEVIAEDAVNLSVFKTLPFSETNSVMVNFLRQSLIGLLLHPTGEDKVSKAFNKLCSTPKLKVLRQALRAFILQFISPKDPKNKDLKFLSFRTQMAIDILETGSGVRL